ncbi:MAG: TetR family transcriptional regulator [Actinobacteria bacterium]|nr:MAG: TetR family transcriptional regulator [Actinomycetota bacterium]
MGDRKGQPARARGPRPGTRDAPLSRDQILDTAFEIVETEGVERLTVRALATKLGVAVTAIYWHVGDKQAVLDGLVERIIAQLGPVQVRGRRPEERIIAIGRSLRQTLLRQPDLVAVVHRQGRTAALFQPARRVLVRELTAAGLDGADAAVAVQAVLSLVVGSVLVDRQLERQPAQRQSPEELWTAEDVPDAPDLLQHLTHPVDEEKLFDFSLGALVRALVSGSRRGQGAGPASGRRGAAAAPATPGGDLR